MKLMKRIFLTIILGSTLFLDLIVPSYAANSNNLSSTLTLDQKIGMNGHVDVPQDILLAGSVVREYHNFGWSITSDKQMYFNKYSWWDFDNYYKSLSEQGITILPCIQMGEQSIYNRNRNEKPVMKGDDTENPQSYKIHSNYLFNYAARYGFTEVDSSRLNLDSNETIKTGLGYIRYYEDWNEPDKTWQGPDAQFSSTELAAMLSADYDGHEGTLGENYGIKNADPNAKLVMGGMAGGATMVTWLSEMQEWANLNRQDKKLPLDVINYHQYTSTHSPENSSFVDDAKKIIAWRDSNASDKEIWITEFGWDTNLSSSHAAPSEDTQRDWIIREYLIGDRIGLDRMTVYDALNDGPSNDSTQYSTSGLATKVSEGAKKKSSWYGVNTLKNILKGYRLSEVIKEDNEMYIYKYTNGEEICYALWSPTEVGIVITDYNLTVGSNKVATLTVLKDKESLGITTNLEIIDSKVKVDVSESPIFIKVSDLNEQDNENGTKIDEEKIETDNENNDEKITNDDEKNNNEKEIENIEKIEIDTEITNTEEINNENEDKTETSEKKIDNDEAIDKQGKESFNTSNNIHNETISKQPVIVIPSLNTNDNQESQEIIENNENSTNASREDNNSLEKKETDKEKNQEINDNYKKKTKDKIEYYDNIVTIPIIIITLILIIVIAIIPNKRRY